MRTAGILILILDNIFISPSSLLFIGHRTNSCFTQLPLCPFRIPFYYSRVLSSFSLFFSQNTLRFDFYFSSFWLFKLFMEQLCKNIRGRGRFYYVFSFLRSCFTTLSMDRKRFYSSPPRWQHEKYKKYHSMNFFLLIFLFYKIVLFLQNKFTQNFEKIT